MATLEQVLIEARQLSARDKLRLIEQLALDVEEVVQATIPNSPPVPYPSLRGAWADLGPGPSEEDIHEMRRLAWGNFPREDS